MYEKAIITYCKNVVYAHYKPKYGHTVVGLGAGNGEVAKFLTRNYYSSIRYIGVDAQPVIYECLANTFNDPGEDFIAVLLLSLINQD